MRRVQEQEAGAEPDENPHHPALPRAPAPAPIFFGLRLRFRLLLRNAVDRSHAPHERFAVDRYNLTVGEYFL